MTTQDLNKISSLLFFSKESLRQLETNKDRLDFNIKYWLKKGKIISLKKGLYITKERWEKEPEKDKYLEFLANKIYEPSCLSLEYVLNKYSLLTEAVYGITSISTKTTETFTNKLDNFSYYSLSPKLFLGFEIKKFGSASILIAKKSKALFDYLYLRFLKNSAINEKVIDELRINWENVNKKEINEIENYVKLTKSIRIAKVINLIKKNYVA